VGIDIHECTYWIGEGDNEVGLRIDKCRVVVSHYDKKQQRAKSASFSPDEFAERLIAIRNAKLKARKEGNDNEQT
jgi:hypothetical protein